MGRQSKKSSAKKKKKSAAAAKEDDPNETEVTKHLWPLMPHELKRVLLHDNPNGIELNGLTKFWSIRPSAIKRETCIYSWLLADHYFNLSDDDSPYKDQVVHASSGSFAVFRAKQGLNLLLNGCYANQIFNSSFKTVSDAITIATFKNLQWLLNNRQDLIRQQAGLSLPYYRVGMEAIQSFEGAHDFLNRTVIAFNALNIDPLTLGTNDMPQFSMDAFDNTKFLDHLTDPTEELKQFQERNRTVGEQKLQRIAEEYDNKEKLKLGGDKMSIIFSQECTTNENDGDHDESDKLGNELILGELQLTISPSMKLKALFKRYADEKGLALRSLRFSYENQPLFASSAGNKTPGDLGLKSMSRIMVTVTDVDESEDEEDEEDEATNDEKKGKVKCSPIQRHRMRKKMAAQQEHKKQCVEEAKQEKLRKKKASQEQERLQQQLSEEAQQQKFKIEVSYILLWASQGVSCVYNLTSFACTHSILRY